jgi:hypothetical protein
MYTDMFNGGRIDFWPVGDRVRVCDTEADGMSVKHSVFNRTKDPDVREYFGAITLGAGHCWEHFADFGQPDNLAEGDCSGFISGLRTTART